MSPFDTLQDCRNACIWYKTNKYQPIITSHRHVYFELQYHHVHVVNVFYLGVWHGDGGKDLEEEQLLGADKECAEPARLKPATKALMAPPPG